ncbi:MAG: helix-turn-helix domain-containing protein [bacterium]
MAAANIHPEDVKATVRKTGATLYELAENNGLHHSTVAKAIRQPIPAGNKAIADHLGRPLNDLWPEWYDENGQRRRSRGRPRKPISENCGRKGTKRALSANGARCEGAAFAPHEGGRP